MSDVTRSFMQAGTTIWDFSRPFLSIPESDHGAIVIQSWFSRERLVVSSITQHCWRSRIVSRSAMCLSRYASTMLSPSRLWLCWLGNSTF